MGVKCKVYHLERQMLYERIKFSGGGGGRGAGGGGLLHHGLVDKNYSKCPISYLDQIWE